MDEYENMLFQQGKYNLQSFNNRPNLTNTVGYFNTRSIGVSPKNIASESRLFNIDSKNTRDQEKKINRFFPEMHINNSTSNIKLEPSTTRESKSCNNTSEYSYIFNLFQPNLMDPQKTVQKKNYIGKNSRFDSR